LTAQAKLTSNTDAAKRYANEIHRKPGRLAEIMPDRRHTEDST
jgi:hypothetical protein